MHSGVAAAIATLLVYIVFFGILVLAGYWLISEISHLIQSISKTDVSSLTAPINSAISRIGEYLNQIDAGFIENNQEKILNLAQTSLSIAIGILRTTLSFLTSLPAIFTMFIVMIFSTYFFSKDMASIKKNLINQFSNDTAHHIRLFSRNGKNLGSRYVCSYLLIYFLTFLETLIVFSLLGVPYPFVISIITGIADILPVLGPGTIYIPLAVIYLVTGKFFTAGALLVCWLLITAIRQIIEPKLISSSVNIHPLTILAAIYFALIANNFWVLLYFTVLAVLYSLLTKDGILPTLLDHKEKSENTDSKEECSKSGK